MARRPVYERKRIIGNDDHCVKRECTATSASSQSVDGAFTTVHCIRMQARKISLVDVFCTPNFLCSLGQSRLYSRNRLLLSALYSSVVACSHQLVKFRTPCQKNIMMSMLKDIFLVAGDPYDDLPIEVVKQQLGNTRLEIVYLHATIHFRFQFNPAKSPKYWTDHHQVHLSLVVGPFDAYTLASSGWVIVVLGTRVKSCGITWKNSIPICPALSNVIIKYEFSLNLWER